MIFLDLIQPLHVYVYLSNIIYIGFAYSTSRIPLVSYMYFMVGSKHEKEIRKVCLLCIGICGAPTTFTFHSNPQKIVCMRAQ